LEGEWDLGTQLAGWFRQLLEQLFETRGMRGFAQGTRLLVLVLALGVLGWALRRLAMQGRTRGAPGRRRSRRDPSDRSLPLDSPQVHLDHAQVLLPKDPRSAIREALLALLSLFERTRYAQPDRVKTNHEIAHELASRGAPAQICADAGALLHWYDQTFYSLTPVDRMQAASFLQKVQQLGASLGGGA
jgi:hypothetical protein